MEFKLKSCARGSYLNVNNDEKTFNNERNHKNALSSQNDVTLRTQQKLDLSFWGLPERILEFYYSKGIRYMFQWQLECLTLGRVLDAGNLVYSAPTSAGKTLVAEILISKSVFELHKKVLIILPFVSVVREKMFYLQGMFASSGIHVEGYMGGHSPSIGFKQVHIAVCTIEKANSIINRLMEEQNLQNLGLVVVDELHLLGDPYRGYLLELLLTKLKYISLKSESKIQIVGMSATLPNLKSLADWLNADLYYTDFRPVPLNEKLKCGNLIFDKKLNKLSEIIPLTNEALDDSENIGQLCLETISNGHSVLIFCPTKIWCENLAEKISLFFRRLGCCKSAETEGTVGSILRKELNLNKINEVIEHLKMSPVGLDKALQKTVAYGVAFHHAGLTLDERDIIEGSFRKGSIRVLCATSTLSSGVNLPARRVIIRSPMSFGGLMDVLTYRQMIGRAGRMGVDIEGESILICKPNEKAMCQTLMCSNLKPIESCLGHGRLSASLKRALLEVIASGIACTPEEIKEYAKCTFLAHSSKHNIDDPMQSCLEFLEENEFIRLQDNGNIYAPTPLAKACLASSLPPDEGLALFRELQRARRCFVLDTDLHIIYQVTPYSVSEQWNKIEWLNVLNTLEGLPASMKRVGDMVGVEEGFLIRVVKGTLNPNVPEIRNKLSIHRRFYTSLALQDLINEIPLPKVAEKYDCNKGMLQSLQQSAATYAGMVTEFTKCLGWSSVELIFSQFQERLQFGIQRELCELMRLPVLNALRARALFNAGFTNLPSIANADINDLENVFFGMGPFQSKKEIAGETKYDRDQRNKLEAVWITGRADLSVREAVELLISESRNILEVELGLTVKWGTNDASALDKIKDNEADFSVPNKIKSNVKCKRNVNDFDISGQHKSDTVQETHYQDRDLGSEIDLKKSEKLLEVISGNDKTYEKTLNNEKFNNGEGQASEVKTISNQDLQNMSNVWQKQILEENEGNFAKELERESLLANREEKGCAENHNLNNAELVAEPKSNNETEKEICCFGSSFDLDVLPESDHVSEVFCQTRDSNDINKNADFILDESGSNSSIEILYDSTVHNGTKNFSFSRLSDDMFEMAGRGSEGIKNMSTPIAARGGKILAEISHNRLVEIRSPDLFSESLTFDTQMGRILDFEERAGEDNPQIINPSSSINSDDLGFVSDLSPQKKVEDSGKTGNSAEKNDRKLELQKAGITDSFLENGLKTLFEEQKESGKPEGKRKVSAVDSPDLMLGTCASATEDQHPSKRVKYNAVEEKEVILSSPSLIVNDSDDEITATPEIDKTHSSVTKNIRLRINSLKRVSQSTSKRINPSCVKSKCDVMSERVDEKPSKFDVIYFPESNVGLKGIDTVKMNGIIVSDNAVSNKVKVPEVNLKAEEIKWDKINAIDVCEGEEEFKLFFEQLKEQNIVGLALGCRQKMEENKNLIGMKITKRKKMENLKDKPFKCQHKDIVLDGIAFYWKENDVFYMTLDDGNVPLEDKLNLLRTISRKEVTLRVYDAKEQIKMLQLCCSALLSSSFQDPKIAFWLLSESWKEKNFIALAHEYLPRCKALISPMGTVAGYSSPGLLARSSTSAKTRACTEAFLTYHMINHQESLLLGKGLRKTFELPEMPMSLYLAEVELAGFQICRSKLSDITEKLNAAQAAVEEMAYSFTQYKFSMSSASAVSKVLHKVLYLEGENITLTKKKKLPSTTKQALLKLAKETKHPLPELILLWRKTRSVITKFISPLLEITLNSAKVFGNYQTFTATGRISMHEPNLQNIPKKFFISTTETKQISINLREVFVASSDCLLVSVDYCQIELRMLAHLSQDTVLINNIQHSSDIFVNIAATVFGVPHYDVDEDLRQRAKQTCYGMVYGIGPRSLAEQLQMDESDAADLINSFKSSYQGVKNYTDKLVSECKKNGYVTTLLNRRRYIPAINDANQAIRLEAERQAINTNIQGSAADLVKIAMVLCREKLKDAFSNKTTARLVLHLHDELIFEVDKGALERVVSILKEAMENAMDLTVPTPVKTKVGPNWGQLKEFEI